MLTIRMDGGIKNNHWYMSEKSIEEVLLWIDAQRDAMLQLLEKLVAIDSGSYNKAGVDRVGEVIEAHLAEEGVATERIPHDVMGDCIRATVPGSESTLPHVLLMGHRDTVFPDGTAAERPFTIHGGQAHGPGVADMKAGLVMNTFLLQAFHRFKVLANPLVALYTSDEEVASPSSRPVIEAAAQGALAALNAEAGRPGGKVVTVRKGSCFLSFRVTGKAAHAGVRPEDGISAIEAVCRIVQALHALTDYESGMTVNVGKISGGDTFNTVAPWAEAQMDLRFKTIEDRERLLTEVRKIITACHLAGTTAEILDEHGFLPLAESAEGNRLFEVYRAAAASEGITCEGVATGGAADSGITANLGVPTICGVGPEGGDFHSPQEFMLVETMVPRSRIAARVIYELAAQGQGTQETQGTKRT